VLFERSAVSLFERGKRAKQVEERERVRERERDDDVVVVVVVVVVDVKFHSAGPRESHSFFPRKKNIKREEKKRVSKEKRKKKSHKAYRRVLIDILSLHFDRPFLRVVMYSQQKQSKERDQAI
jgi:hypothetical protein